MTTDIEKTDPTKLTTQMVLREVGILEDKVDNAVITRQREQAFQKELLESKLGDITIIHEEKLLSIKTQFELLERQRVEQKLDTKQAVDAALIAQKEAVHEQTIASGLSIAKSEAATAKQLDQLSITMSTAIAGVTQSASETKDNLNATISDLKERLLKIEAIKVGITEERRSTRDNIGIIYTIGGIVLVIITIVGTLVASGIFTK